MALREKPKPTTTQERPPHDERQVRALIHRGGSVALSQEEAKANLKLVQLRLPAPLIGRIDAHRGIRTVPPSRHSWILEAIMEKLETS